ncbi:triacylglycerol lipase V precursor [Fusarium tjaetaba]|uniref:Triacylglycerol lipase V n=1 Tax=Fusarium tjaetaba TaxID=1567544 RepID=A0A8H5R3W8_9HYPO|nr:triacylglycerol lipase V precursor [Fusarium tjaetaba]KAF5625838.1 triacylglycerol lipase V precursor [Fusarium tjaetaba]
MGLKSPPTGPCLLWLPTKSYIGLSGGGDNSDAGNWPVVCRFYVGDVLFLLPISVNVIGNDAEFVKAAPISFRMALEPDLKEELCDQIHDCVNKRGVHQDCDVGWFRQDLKPKPPTRLIDVDTNDSSIVRLIVTAEDLHKDFIPRYLTLSYCWGSTNEHAKTTRATIAARREGIAVHDLPKTIQDAIQLTRLLKFRYLWIDAICIIQSDIDDVYLDDWNTEAPRIGAYYLHSKCLISASAASDSSQGLYVEQSARRYPLSTCALAFSNDKQEYISLLVPRPSPSEDWSAEPLRSRGWCLQEAVLSPRILHWSKHALIWQCNGTTKSLAYGSDLDTARDIRASQSHLSLAQEPDSAMGEAWTELISRYSKMHFTFETDRLIAIQGLANRLVDLHGGEYFAGVFHSHLADGLLWKNSYDKAHNALNGVPTWSWATRCLNIWFLPVSYYFIRFTKPNVFPDNRSPINLDTPEKRALRFEAPLLSINLGRPFTEADIVSTVRRPVFSCHVRFTEDSEDEYAVNFEYDAESLMPETKNYISASDQSDGAQHATKFSKVNIASTKSEVRYKSGLAIGYLLVFRISSVIVMVSYKLLTVAFCTGATLALPQSKTASAPTATIDNGIIIGTSTSIPDSKVEVNQFLGIPFAEKPIRFSAPKPAKPWDTPYNATVYKPACFMKFNYPEERRNQTIKIFATPGAPAGTSEDCLNLNIYTPAGAKAGSKPVAFWIHGGSFSHGSGSLPYYEGSKMAGYEDLVVVTVNYRTNIFGFPETYDLPKGQWNLGFLDQRLALSWVQDNIATFGGDPKKVTIFGESAGAGSVDDLLTAPPDPLPFRAAILQSGSASTNVTPTGSWNTATKLAGCENGDFDQVLECMREIPAAKLKDIIERGMLDFAPLSDDGVTLSNYPRDIRIQSKSKPKIMARVPVMLGTTADEARIPQFMDITVKDALKTLAPGISDFQVSLLKFLYPIGSPGINNEFDQVTRIATEIGMQCPIRYVAEDFAEADIKTWRYIYNASFANTEIFKGSGAYHSAEIPTLFGTFPEKGATEFQDKLSREMQKAWGEFIRGPENGPGWGQIPKVGVFGGGARPDIAKEPVKTLDVRNANIIEPRCLIFKSIWEKGQTKD